MTNHQRAKWTNYYHDMWIVHHNAGLTIKSVLEELERQKDKINAAFGTPCKDPKAEAKVRKCRRKRA